MHVHSFRPKIIPLNATRLFSIHKCSMNIFISEQNIKYHKNERRSGYKYTWHTNIFQLPGTLSCKRHCMIHALAGPRLPYLWVKKKSCTYSRITNDSQINLSCYLVFLLWYVELKYHLIKSVLKPLKLGVLPPGPHQGFALDPDPSLLGPSFNKSKIPQWHVLEIALYA